MFWCWRCLDIYRGVSVAHPAPLSTVVHRSKVKVVTKATLIHCVLMKVQEVRTAEARDDIDDDLMPRYCTGGQRLSQNCNFFWITAILENSSFLAETLLGALFGIGHSFLLLTRLYFVKCALYCTLHLRTVHKLGNPMMIAFI